eukprot:scpid49760/ scgid4665/ 
MASEGLIFVGGEVLESDDDEEDLPESVEAVLSRWWRSMPAGERNRISCQHSLEAHLSPRSRIWSIARFAEWKVRRISHVLWMAIVGQSSGKPSRQEKCKLVCI